MDEPVYGPTPLMRWVTPQPALPPGVSGGGGDTDPDSTQAVKPDTRQVRVGNAERETVSGILNAALVGGYLDLEEFSTRTEKVAASVWESDFDDLLEDLPDHLKVTEADRKQELDAKVTEIFGHRAGGDPVVDTITQSLPDSYRTAGHLSPHSPPALPRSATAKELGINEGSLLYRVVEAGRVGGMAPSVAYGIIVNAKTPEAFIQALRDAGSGRSAARISSVTMAVVFAVVGLMAVIAASPPVMLASMGAAVIGGLFAHSLAGEVISYRYKTSGADERIYQELAGLDPRAREIAAGYVYQAGAVDGPPTLTDLVGELGSKIRGDREAKQLRKKKKD